MLIVLDSNVLVSGLLNPFEPPGRILDLILVGTVRLAYDDRILVEYREVTRRPRFGFNPTLIKQLIDYLVFSGEPVNAAPLKADPPHPGDLPFAEVAIAAKARALVTGNAHHFAFLSDPPVLSPVDFLALWAEENSQGSD